LVVYDAACLVMVLLGTVLLVSRLAGIPGALLQEGVGDLVVNVLMEHVLVRGLYVPVEILQPGRLARADELVVDEAILDVVDMHMLV
jgi:hypothetical protein